MRPNVTPQRSAQAGERDASGLAGAVTDAELLEAIAQGNESAFEEFRRRYQAAVERACRPLVGAELEDCAQEVFVRVWRKAPLYDRARGSGAAWLLTLARHTAVNLGRAGRRDLAADQVEPTAAASSDDVERFWLEAALERLPERERRVIELAYYSDLSESAIAQRLRVPLGSVKSWKRRGLHRLATLLGEASA